MVSIRFIAEYLVLALTWLLCGCRYGTPEQDGRYLHWDHEVLPHWREEVRARYPPDVKFIPPHDIHSPYYPEIGCCTCLQQLLLWWARDL